MMLQVDTRGVWKNFSLVPSIHHMKEHEICEMEVILNSSLIVLTGFCLFFLLLYGQLRAQIVSQILDKRHELTTWSTIVLAIKEKFVNHRIWWSG